MAERKRSLDFISTRPARVLTATLLVQAAFLYGLSRVETRPTKEPLSSLPANIATWQLLRETPIDKDTLEVLKADETLSREYSEPGNPLRAQLFVAYFNTQRTGQAPHSPRNCLPAAGWLASRSDTVQVPIAGRSPLEINRYVVSKGEYKSLVLYWYQSRDRAVASEYAAKIYSVLDAIRYNRTDTALVRVIVPVVDDENDSAKIAIRFVQAVYPALRQRLPA